MTKSERCKTCQSEMIHDPMRDMRKNRICIECDFKPDAIKKFVKELFPPAPKWAIPSAHGFAPEKIEPILEPKALMNPYLADVFALVDEDESAIRDGLLFGGAFNYTILLGFARDRYTYKYAWAIPCQAALETLAKYSPIVEIGAGSGYWASLLHKMGADIVAYDDAPENFHLSKKAYQWRWFDVQKGDESTARQYSDRALFLCWPPYNEDMAYNCAKQYQGDTILFVGEMNGCTGTEEFFNYLDEHFDREEFVELPVWLGLHDALYVFRRKKAGKKN